LAMGTRLGAVVAPSALSSLAWAIFLASNVGQRTAAESLRAQTQQLAKEEHTELVVACNGYVDGRAALVGVRPPPTITGAPRKLARAGSKHLRRKRRAPAIALQLRLPRGQNGRASLHAVDGQDSNGDEGKATSASIGDLSAGALWTRWLNFGECEEYHLDLSQRQLFFVEPDGLASCELSVPMVEQRDHGGRGYRVARPPVAAVLARVEASSKRCAVRAAAFSLGSPTTDLKAQQQDDLEDSATAKDPAEAAEIVVLDAFVDDVPLEKGPSLRGLGNTLDSLDGGPVVRLEDSIEPETITSEVVGTRILSLGHVHKVDAKDVHVTLEDTRGLQELDRKEVTFKPGWMYVGIRVGQRGDPKFPERLLVHSYEAETEAEAEAE